MMMMMMKMIILGTVTECLRSSCVCLTVIRTSEAMFMMQGSLFVS